MVENPNRKPIVLGLRSSYEVRSFASRQLVLFAIILLYTFRDISSYHSNAMSEVAAAAHVCRSLDCEIEELDQYGCSDIISCPFPNQKYLCLVHEVD